MSHRILARWLYHIISNKTLRKTTQSLNVSSEMVFGQHIYILNLFVTLLTSSVCTRTQEPGKFTFRNVRDSVLPAIQPLIAAGSKRCAYFKNIFGITYDQMQARNASRQEDITIDLITETDQIKNVLTETKNLKALVQDKDKVVVLIHGFGESSEGEMVQALSSELLKQEGLKIFALDGRNTITFEYLRSSTYSRFMGEILGEFLSHLIKEGYDPSKISLIGHSLGSHIAGTAGKRVYNQTGKLIGRITALDPAGPCFHNVSHAERLDRSDAVYVDVIHTNGGVLGMNMPVGHKDFYPNGGMSQPGCMFYICDHSRAWEFYAESINKPTAFPARKCFNWTTFSEGKCNKTALSYMGVNSEKGSEGMYFLSTGRASPFGLESTD